MHSLIDATQHNIPLLMSGENSVTVKLFCQVEKKHKYQKMTQIANKKRYNRALLKESFIIRPVSQLFPTIPLINK